jgi:hypothetical protein
MIFMGADGSTTAERVGIVLLILKEFLEMVA